MLKILKDKSVQKQLLFAVITLFMLFFIWLKWLNNYTNHNDVVNVPDFDGIHIKSLDSLADAHGLRYEIIDSVFEKSKQKGVVVYQDPLPNTRVKEN
jgi:eukaryotic-like serine/threonine-protein kinase